MTDRRRVARLLALAVVSAVVAACGTAEGRADGGYRTDAVADTTVAGSVDISGSSTVEPISALVREEFIAQNADVDISVDGPGTGDGFELFCSGDTDISDASRLDAELARSDAKSVNLETLLGNLVEISRQIVDGNADHIVESLH